MEPLIGTLTIEGFRAFRHLKIEDLGRVNLITGRNSTGKSSILEALRILAADASPAVVDSILRYREEGGCVTEESRLPPVDVEYAFEWSSLFHGFPEFSDEIAPIVIESAAGRHPSRLAIRAGWRSQADHPVAAGERVAERAATYGDANVLPELVVEARGGWTRVLLEDLRGLRRWPRIRVPGDDGRTLQCVFVNPYGGERSAALGPLWDSIALSDLEDDVVEALRIIDPGISAVSMVGGEGPRQARTAIVRADGIPRPVPLRSFGDGLNRLFGIVLSLVNAKDGLLLIDEFENGMHHTVQADVWRAIFRLASRLDVQVFATTHSWDAVVAFQEAANEHPEEGVLIRLTRRDDDIIPTRFSEGELAIAARDRIEVR